MAKGAFKGQRILVVEDDLDLSRMLALILEDRGAMVVVANRGRQALQQFFRHRPALVVLDVMLPDVDGWEICRQIRLLSETPVLMLTSARENSDVVRGLDLGADDYLTKPFDVDIFLARCRAILRRAGEPAHAAPAEVYGDGYLTVDFAKRRVFVDGRAVKLSATEFQLLAYLVANGGHILTYRQILEKVWGRTDLDAAEYVHLYVYYLRKKLEPDPGNPRYLLTEHGVGYRFEKARAGHRNGSH